MGVRLVSFDCAGTLVHTRWNPGEFAVEVGEAIGMKTPEGAADRYNALVVARRQEYETINLRRDEAEGDAYWRDLTLAWLSELGLPAAWEPRLAEVARERGFGPNSRVFRVFSDAAPCLKAIRARGVKMAILSNWDYSLHRIIEALGLKPYFDLVVASLEHGFEKPDPRIFQLMLDHFGVSASEAAHVGDDPLDDLEGAKLMGMQSFLVDRSQAKSSVPILRTLEDLEGAVRWSG